MVCEGVAHKIDEVSSEECTKFRVMDPFKSFVINVL